MIQLGFRFNFILLIWLCLFAISYGLGNGSARGRMSNKADSQKQVYNGLGYANGDYQMKQASGSKPVQPKQGRGMGLSAWGIIGVITASLFLGTVMYYTVLFYPILCKKERKYDIMDLTSV